MKEKDFDQLIAAAFDEMRAEDRAALEAGLDPAAKAELAAFTQLRETMGRLPEPGACQVSPEMLRDRILNAGVQSKPAWFGWAPRLALGGLAAALAFVVMNTFTSPGTSAPTPSPAISVAKNDPVVTKAPVDPAPEVPVVVTPKVDKPMSEGEVTEAPRSVVRKTRVSSGRRSARRSADAVVTKVEAVVAQPKAVVAAETAGAPAMDSAMARSMRGGSSEETAVATVVIISQEEGEVGAPVATEVSAGSEDVGIKG